MFLRKYTRNFQNLFSNYLHIKMIFCIFMRIQAMRLKNSVGTIHETPAKSVKF